MATRKKHVFNEQMVAHLWVHQTQSNARNSRNNFYYEGRSIYSYGRHFEIARIIEENVILFTVNTHSVTTAKHIRWVHSAIPSNYTVIRCIDIDFPNNWRKNSKDWVNSLHRKNITNLTKTLEEYISKASRARKGNNQWIFKVQEERDNLNLYLNYFKCKGLLKKSERLLLETNEDWKCLIINAKALMQKEQEQADKKLAKNNAKRIEEWLKGENHIDAIGQLVGYNDVRLRVIGDSTLKEIQTSKGYRLNYAEAYKLFGLIKRIRENITPGKDKKYTIKKFLEKQKARISGFDVRDVSEEGNILVGCHFIKWIEIERIAKQEGWI